MILYVLLGFSRKKRFFLFLNFSMHFAKMYIQLLEVITELEDKKGRSIFSHNSKDPSIMKEFVVVKKK